MVKIRIDEDENNYRFRVQLNEFEETYREDSLETLRGLKWSDFKEENSEYENLDIANESRLISLEVDKAMDYVEIDDLTHKLNQYIDKRVIKKC